MTTYKVSFNMYIDALTENEAKEKAVDRIDGHDFSNNIEVQGIFADGVSDQDMLKMGYKKV